MHTCGTRRKQAWPIATALHYDMKLQTYWMQKVTGLIKTCTHPYSQNYQWQPWTTVSDTCLTYAVCLCYMYTVPYRIIRVQVAPHFGLCSWFICSLAVSTRAIALDLYTEDIVSPYKCYQRAAESFTYYYSFGCMPFDAPGIQLCSAFKANIWSKTRNFTERKTLFAIELGLPQYGGTTREFHLYFA